MEDFDKTLKIRAFTPEPKREAAPEPAPADRGFAAQLEEERKKALECLNLLERQREFIKQEQAKSADLQARLAAAEGLVAASEGRANAAEAKAAVADSKVRAAEAKVKDLTDALDRITSIAATMVQVSRG